MYKIFFIAGMLVITACSTSQETQQTEKEILTSSVFIGTYTRTEGHVDGKAAGILELILDEKDQLVDQKVVADIVNPSFVALGPDSNTLYAVSETGPDDGDQGWVFLLKKMDNEWSVVDSAGTGGFAPCHVSVNSTGNLVLVSNYVGGVVSIYKSSKDRLEIIQQLQLEGSGNHPRQESSHTHMSILSPDEQYLYIADLGSNVIWNYRLKSEEEQFIPNQNQPFFALPEASGPRHMDFHPNGKMMAVICELSNTIHSLGFDTETGVLSAIDQVSSQETVIEVAGNSTADIHFHPNGNFLYGSNRGANTIAVLSVSASGKLEVIQQENTRGEFPRNFAISTDGAKLWVANQNSDNISQYQIDPNKGQLTYLKEFKEVMTPVCIAGL